MPIFRSSHEAFLDDEKGFKHQVFIYFIEYNICLFHPCCCCSCVMNFTSTSTVYYSVICQGRQVLFTIFIKFRQKSFRIWFQIGSNFFGRGKKMHLKKNDFCRFLHFFQKRFFASTSTAIFSVICCARQLLFTIFIKFRQKSFIIWFQIGSNFFGRHHKLHFKKTIFTDFCRRTNTFIYWGCLKASSSSRKASWLDLMIGKWHLGIQLCLVKTACVRISYRVSTSLNKTSWGPGLQWTNSQMYSITLQYPRVLYKTLKYL